MKLQRDKLSRFRRYLPTLKLKQQQIQASIVQTRQTFGKTEKAVNEMKKIISVYDGLFNDVAGVNFKQLATADSIETTRHSIAGVYVPQFKAAIFPESHFSLFATSPWVDKTLADLKTLNRQTAELNILQECLDLLLAELKKVMQRVNLFEKVMIPATLENIRRIRIALGDQMTAGVARAKIAKAKLEQKEHQRTLEAVAV